MLSPGAAANKEGFRIWIYRVAASAPHGESFRSLCAAFRGADAGMRDRCLVSPRQFSRAFRDETGQTPAKAVERLRVEAATDYRVKPA